MGNSESEKIQKINKNGQNICKEKDKASKNRCFSTNQKWNRQFIPSSLVGILTSIIQKESYQFNLIHTTKYTLIC